MDDGKLTTQHRDMIKDAAIGLTKEKPNTENAFSMLILRVLISIDARLEKNNG